MRICVYLLTQSLVLTRVHGRSNTPMAMDTGSVQILVSMYNSPFKRIQRVLDKWLGWSKENTSGDWKIMLCYKVERCSEDDSYMSTGHRRQIVVVVQSLSRVRVFAAPWTAAHKAALSFTISLSLLKLIHDESVTPSKPLHSLSSPSPPAFSLSKHQGFLQWISSLHYMVRELELHLQHQSFQWIFRVDFL